MGACLYLAVSTPSLPEMERNGASVPRGRFRGNFPFERPGTTDPGTTQLLFSLSLEEEKKKKKKTSRSRESDGRQPGEADADLAKWT